MQLIEVEKKKKNYEGHWGKPSFEEHSLATNGCFCVILALSK